MREHVFLCGLSKQQRKAHPGGTALSFERGEGQLKLKLDQLRDRMAGSEPDRLTDFVEMASYVLAADRMTSRGPLDDPGFGADWRRKFRIVVAARDPAFWRRADVGPALSDALEFLSEDMWQFEFVENQHPIPLQQYLGLRPADAVSEGMTSIVLFSGGLDSLAGAVHELRTPNRHVVLVSHRNLSTVGARQKYLAARLASDFPTRVSHVWVDSSLTDETVPVEETQRTRTFFFAAIGAVAAHIDPSDRVRFYENGVMSVNLPFATQLVGARASRSTHPRSLQLLERVVKLVSKHEIVIDNPFVWQTKVDVVRGLAKTPQAGLIAGTTSCSRSQYAIRRFQPHCGTCVQCLQRRISTLGSSSAELDESAGYETDFLEGPRADGVDRTMAVETIRLALDCSSISDKDFLARFANPLSWVLQAYPVSKQEEVARQVIGLYRSHGQAVRAILVEAIGNYAEDLVSQTLPSSSLLALVLKDRLIVEPPSTSSPEPQLPPVSKPDSARASGAILISVDEERQAIRIFDQPELRGTTIFRIIKLLIALSLEDRSRPGLPDNYRCVRAKKIADELELTEEPVRAAILRARDLLKEAAKALGLPFDPHAIIESKNLGYRLNPKVGVADLQEFLELAGERPVT